MTGTRFSSNARRGLAVALLGLSGLLPGAASGAQPLCRGEADQREAAALYEQAGQQPGTPVAEQLLRRSIALCPVFQNQLLLAETMLRLERYPEAEATASKALQLAASPENEIKGWVLVADARRDQNDWAGAKAAYEAAAKRVRGQAPAWFLDRYAAFEEALYARGPLPAADIARSLRSLKSTGAVPRIGLRVEFAYDSAALTDQGRKQLQEVAKAMTDGGGGEDGLKVIGHTDQRGADAYNLALSQRRAQAAVAELARLQPELANRLQAEGRGKQEPQVPDAATEAQHALNRRVEFEVLMGTAR